MVSVASRYFEGVGFRGMFNVKNAMRFTLMKFDDREEAATALSEKKRALEEYGPATDTYEG